MSTQPFTIPSLPDHLDSALREKAAAENKSLDTVVIEILERGLVPAGESDDLLDELAGSWEEDSDFDKAVEAFEAVDEDLWK